MTLTAPYQRLTVPLGKDDVPRCPICGTKFLESLNGTAEATCKDRRHPRGLAVRITFTTA